MLNITKNCMGKITFAKKITEELKALFQSETHVPASADCVVAKAAPYAMIDDDDDDDDYDDDDDHHHCHDSVEC